jgi:hypothetical protein
MASDLRGYSADEVLNKVLNTSNDSIQVDIVAGAEYAEDSGHTSTDTGNFILGVRNDTLAALGGTDGDYVPFQMNASGALYVEVSSSSGDDSIYVDDADWTDSTSSHTLVGGLYQSSPQSITDGDTGPLQVNANGNLIVDLSATDNAVLDAMVVDLAAMEVLLTAANVDHAANEALLITIDEDTNAIKGHVDGIETLITSTNSKIDTFDAVLDNILTKNTEIDAVLDTIKVDTELLDNAISGTEMQVDVVAALPAGSNTIGVVDLGSTDNAVLDAMVVDLAEIEVATEASQAALEKMLYGTAVAITAVDGGSDQDIQSGATYEALYIGVGGDVTVTLATDTEDILFKNLASGQLLPIRLTDVKASNTTATHMIALKA